MADKKHGGARPNAGRKKMNRDDKKIRLTVWPKGISIRKAGGLKAAKLLALKALEGC